MTEDFVIESEARKTLDLMKPNGQLFEVRIINRGKQIISGYFTSADKLFEALQTVDLRETNIYLTLNYINSGCYSRTQRDRFRVKVATTSDNDIDGFQWLLVDFDPERPSETSSSKEELQKAADLAKTVYQYLKNSGFKEPIKALSGNGYHLLYRVNLANNDENKELVKNFLYTLNEMFSNPAVKIDTVNCNPSRICKLHGTLAQKGSNTEERPFRFSRIFSTIVPEITDKAIIQNFVGISKPEEKPTYRETAPTKDKFNLEDFLRQHGISYKEGGNARDGGTVYRLDECPFNSSHINGDAKIILFPDGKINFFCHHNSCRGKKWQDVRLLYDPHAYDHDRTEMDKRIDDGWKQHNSLKEQIQSPEQKTNEPLFRNAVQILDDKEPDHEFIKSGIIGIDAEITGLEKQCVSVISGLRGSGKSTLIGQIVLNGIQSDQTVVVYSGELANRKYLNWILRQAAGEPYIEKSAKYKNGYGVPTQYQQMIASWMGERFWLYNNSFGNRFSTIAAGLENILREKKADLCIIDNLMILDLDGSQSDKYEAQKEFVLKLKDIATKTNTHIIFVAHPRKSTGYIRLEDIAGTGDISNIIDNAFMVHRNNMDFQKRLKEFDENLYKHIDHEASNFVEIAKDRDNGTQDYFVPLYFESGSKRLKNSKEEQMVYGWVPDQIDAQSGMKVVETENPF